MSTETIDPVSLWELAIDDGDGVWWGTPADPAVARYYERQRERIERALDYAHGMQGAPGRYPFLDLVLERLERQYQSRREEIVRNYRRRQRRAGIDRFEWVNSGTADTATEAQAATAADPRDLICADCNSFALALGLVGQKRVCADCYDQHGYAAQTHLAEF